ncbi:transglutaminase-like domain-containing protein [Saccharibacillus alkalitolerans]|uniref:Transglutaminase domain-containing protein n=1 Tax=Saccharibacillus alkalitolerans TaxID=2705290 RepID=A0ABX0FDG3_9BACL|nr:transglutaminase domain-containing protein [Saccharibacillus alkalitolerans]NGZ77793.1 transglutaminase domain-containing protein [Saccharibacillus alkalitolerans]
MKIDETMPGSAKGGIKDGAGETAAENRGIGGSAAAGGGGADRDGRTLSLGPERTAAIREAFARRRELASTREQELFGVLDGPLNGEERLALEFLYAHMPINDLADYDGELFLTHVRQALTMRRRMPWGTEVPDELFLNYVLPPRINNERLEDYRSVIAGELAERVRHLSMGEAVLETNYWCYEKATYTGSDARTISPLGLMRSAKGRCGEESTLATAALRSIGIPARQCYTPRWAHVDDNHAWVEAWADGAWHFIGACEPEPRLDRGWFDGPARRAMLVHTRVPSGYAGPEPVTYSDEAHTEINLLANYAPVRALTVRVTEKSGRPASGADVQFQIYNYAELHPIATVRANEAGEVRFVTGFGDLVVRAAQNGAWGEAAVSGSTNPAEEETVTLVLDGFGQPEGEADFDLTPPKEIPPEASEAPLAEEELTRHRERMAEGERIRAAYEGRFATEAEAGALAGRLGLDADRVFKVLGDARGNKKEIAGFLEDRTPDHGEWPLRLLESLTDKDMIDVGRETLDDHLLQGLRALEDYESAESAGLAGNEAETGTESKPGNRADAADPGEISLPYVFCPRVRWERLAPYRSRLREAFSAEERAAFRADPRRLARRVAEDLRAFAGLTPVPGKASPAGTFDLKAGDPESVEILLVALCRAMGIPARLHPATRRPQALADGEWMDLERPIPSGEERSAAVDSADQKPGTTRGTLRLLRAGSGGPAIEASYRENFTLARLDGGIYTTLEYPFRRKDVYDKPFELEEGEYRMTTGVRLQDGRVLGRMFYFTVKPGLETALRPAFRLSGETLPVLGAAAGASRLRLPGEAGRTLGALAGSDGALVAWIDYRLEPTRHLLREAGELKNELEAESVPLLFIMQGQPEGEEIEAALPEEIRPFVPGPLPSGASFAYDPSGEAFGEMTSVCPPPGSEYPHLFVLDAELNVRYAESGYKPGSCREALNVLRAVRG